MLLAHFRRTVTAVLVAASFAAFTLPGHAQGGTPAAAPFTLDWTEGICKHCGTAKELGAVRFNSPTDVWAVGNFPGGGDISPAQVIVHSIDAGKIWREMKLSSTHTAEPALAFIDGQNGWISGMSPIGDSWVYRTIDDGRHWITISDQALQQMIFLDALHGFGKAGDHFLRSSNGGQTWLDSEVPKLNYIDRIFFVNAQRGWAAGSDGNDALVLCTQDSGQNWQAVTIHAPSKTAHVRDLYFTSPLDGWLVTWDAGNAGSQLYRTSDGGQTWTAASNVRWQGAGYWLAGVRFIGAQQAFAYGRQDAGGAANPGLLLYSADAGEHWQKFDLPRSVADCQAVEGNLMCSALPGGLGFWLLTIHPTTGVAH